MKLARNLSKFIEEIDPDIFSRDAAATALHSYDATNRFYYPEGVVRPRHAKDVQQIILAANLAEIPLFPRGAGTGFSGGSLPVDGGVVVDFLGMNRIVDFDEEGMMARVEPGLITIRLHEEAEKHGLFYPPDPASYRICTIGGNVAENAGGPHCLKYGVTRDYVLAIEGFTADGRPFKAGKPIHKNRAGYDLRHFLIGSEGTLGIFTEFTLKLIPKPEASLLFLALFPDLESAGMIVNRLLRKGICPSSLEFMDEFAIQAVESFANLGIPAKCKALLLIEIDGRSDELPHLKKRVEECLSGTVLEIRTAQEKADQESLWEVRRKVSPAMRQFGNTKANEDIVVPRKHITATIREIRRISERNHLNIINFGHIGDGNIHVNIMYDEKNESEKNRVDLALEEIFSLVNGFDGAVSGEHGIGLSKKKFLPRNLDSVSYEIMRKIKHDFDPKGILNPHKIFTDDPSL